MRKRGGCNAIHPFIGCCGFTAATGVSVVSVVAFCHVGGLGKDEGRGREGWDDD